MKFSLPALLLAMAFTAQSQVTTLQLASDVWPPFTNMAGEKAVALDLVREALTRTGVKMNAKIMNFSDVMTGIEENAFDGSAALWKNEQRMEYLLFSAPYLNNQLILVSRKGNEVHAASLAELEGKRVAIVGTYAYGILSDDNEGARLIEGRSDQENLEKLLRGDVDYMLVDALLIQYLMTYQREELSQYLEVGSQPLFQRSLHFALRKDYPNALEIMAKFNKEVIKMMADGTYNRILELNWIRTDIDGDGKVELVLYGNQAGTSAPKSSYDIYFQDSGTTASTEGQRYYVDGNIYRDWNSVPTSYKVSPRQDEVQDVTILKFRF